MLYPSSRSYADLQMASQDRRYFSNGATRGNCCMGLLVAISFAFKSDGASDYSEEVAAGLNVDVG